MEELPIHVKTQVEVCGGFAATKISLDISEDGVAPEWLEHMDKMIAAAQARRAEALPIQQELPNRLSAAKAKVQKVQKTKGVTNPEYPVALQELARVEKEVQRIDDIITQAEAEANKRGIEKKAYISTEDANALATFLASCVHLFRLQIKATESDALLCAVMDNLPKGLEEFSLGGAQKWRHHNPTTSQGLEESPNYGSCRVTERGIAALARALPGCLTTLCLSKLKLGDAGIEAIAANGLPPCLQHLDLHCCAVGERGCLPLVSALPAGLVTMDLGDNRRIRDAGIAALAEAMPRLTNLRSLNIASCGMTQQGLLALVSRLPSRIEVLELSGNELYDNGALMVAEVVPNLGKLHRLNMTVCELTRVGKDRLRATWLQAGKVDTPLYDLSRKAWTGLDL